MACYFGGKRYNLGATACIDGYECVCTPIGWERSAKECSKLTTFSASKPRSLTDEEQTFIRTIFPRMNLDSVAVTDEQTRTYNCLAWTLGITDRWVWPTTAGGCLASKADFDALYTSHGLSPNPSHGSVCAFGLAPESRTHGSLYSSVENRWESKCGAWLRIQHGLFEMAGGDSYGDPLEFYEPLAVGAVERDKELQLATVSVGELDKIILRGAQGVSNELKTVFEKHYDAWFHTWNHPSIQLSSNPEARTHSIEFSNLLRLGKEILPLVAEKLLDRENFFALLLVDRIAPLATVRYTAIDDPLILEGEQSRAVAFLRRWAMWQS